MKHRIASILLLPLCLLGLRVFGQSSDLESIINGEKAAWIKAQTAQDRGVQILADNRSDVRYCRLHWTVDPAIKYITGEVMTIFDPSETVAGLDFDCSAALTMDSVLYHGQTIPLRRKAPRVSTKQAYCRAYLPQTIRNRKTLGHLGKKK